MDTASGRRGASVALKVMRDNSKEPINNDNNVQLVVKKLVVICTLILS
jgi:hypothetical protein